MGRHRVHGWHLLSVQCLLLLRFLICLGMAYGGDRSGTSFHKHDYLSDIFDDACGGRGSDRCLETCRLYRLRCRELAEFVACTGCRFDSSSPPSGVPDILLGMEAGATLDGNGGIQLG